VNATEGTFRQLSDRQIEELRRRHPYQIDFPRDAETVRERGWVDTNVAYLEGEKSRSAAAMRDLMRAVGVERVRSREEALDLVALACEVFAPDAGFTGAIRRRRDGTMTISVRECPVYQAMEDAGWLGMTACPSWHRRRGWFEALGVKATDSVIADKKWGTRACFTIIDVTSVD
jgi:hypothetical protein